MTSLKKLTAVLAAVALPVVGAAQAPAAPAAPPKPLVTVYGTFNVNFQVSELHGAEAGPPVDYRFGVSADSTNVGVRGTADVAHGLGVVYQCETGANIDGIALASLCNRNSRLGLSSAWGTLFYGNWDTPFKAAWYGTKADDPFGNTDVFDAAGIMGSPGFRTKSTAGLTGAESPTTAPSATGPGANLTFAVRAANSVAYHSPKFAGVTVRAQYSANEFADNDTIASPELYSAGVNYDMGPISVLAAWERHMDWNGGNTEDDGFKAGIGYELGTPFGTTTIAVNADYLTYKNNRAAGAQIEEWNRLAGFVGLKHRTGNHEFRARYSLADEAECDRADGASCDAVSNETGAQQFAVGYAYHLSKAAQVYGFWTQIMNDDRAQFTFATAGIAAVTPGPAATFGADPWAAGLGMRYAF